MPVCWVCRGILKLNCKRKGDDVCTQVQSERRTVQELDNGRDMEGLSSAPDYLSSSHHRVRRKPAIDHRVHKLEVNSNP